MRHAPAPKPLTEAQRIQKTLCCILLSALTAAIGIWGVLWTLAALLDGALSILHILAALAGGILSVTFLDIAEHETEGK